MPSCCLHTVHLAAMEPSALVQAHQAFVTACLAQQVAFAIWPRSGQFHPWACRLCHAIVVEDALRLNVSSESEESTAHLFVCSDATGRAQFFLAHGHIVPGAGMVIQHLGKFRVVLQPSVSRDVYIGVSLPVAARL